MKEAWIVLANSARARIFQRGADGRLEELWDLIHGQSREKGRDLASDRDGHAQRAHGDRGHDGTAFEPRTGPHRKEQEVFALEIARHLQEAIAQRHCPGLVLIASDPFLGELKSHLSSSETRLLGAAIPKDLTSFTGAELARRITDALQVT